MKFTEEQIKNREFSLDVIIPQYNETEEIIKPLLNSIEFQTAINKDKIGVIIVNDHSNTKLSDEFLKSFNLNIRYLETPENKGPGQARQFGLDASEADYVVFADSDDRFFACNVFAEIFNAIVSNQDKDLDILFTPWIEELPVPDGRILNITHNPGDSTWCHGKFWRRKFLTERNLRFNENIRVHEDSYFNTIVQMNAGYTANVGVTSYYWAYNNKSLTRNSEYKYNYLVETADDLVISIKDTMSELVKRKTERREEYLIKGVLFMYYILQAPYWNEKLAEDIDLQKRRRRFEWGVFQLIQQYADIFNNTPRANFLQYKNDERAQCCLNTGFESEYETWEQFINRLSQQYPAYTKTCHTCKHYKEGVECPFGKDNSCTMNLDTELGIYSIPSKYEENSSEINKPKTKKQKSE